jgi:chromosome segregation ATPase
MKSSTATAILTILLLHPTPTFSFQLPSLNLQRINNIIHNPASQLSAKRNSRPFTNDGSSKGFGSRSNGNNPPRNGKQRNITSVKDVDAALNDEIEGALMSAEMDLRGAADPSDDVDVVMPTKLPKEQDTPTSSSWDDFKESIYQTADTVKSVAKGSPPSFAADYTPVPPETPGEKAMKEWSAIDVNVVATDSTADFNYAESDDNAANDNAVMSNEERMLLQAQKEAQEAEALLREAELESLRLELELQGMTAASSTTASSSPPTDTIFDNLSSQQQEEEDALSSMASAYQAALDAANDNVNLLTEQIEELEQELSQATLKMEQASEDKERVSAEYAYLASNYREYKAKMDAVEEDSRIVVEEYKAKISTLEKDIDSLKNQLSAAQTELSQWQTNYESIQSEMKVQQETSLKIQTELQSTLDDVTSTFEITLLDSQKEYEESLTSITSEYEEVIDQSKKMIAALRTSLRKTRSEVKASSVASDTTASEAVEDVRGIMNEEVEKLRGALRGLEGRAGENEEVLRREKEERDKLLEEIE